MKTKRERGVQDTQDRGSECYPTQREKERGAKDDASVFINRRGHY